MMKSRYNNPLLFTCCLLFAVLTKAQQFQHQAFLNTVKQSGFYRIAVTPELSAYLQTDLRDLRIKDTKGKVAPYIVRSRQPKWQNALFKPFPVLQNVLNDSGNSEIIFEKSVSNPLNTFWIVQRNSNVVRQASLHGSDDQKNWFMIEKYVLLNDHYETLSDSNFQSIPIAGSSYHYYKLVVENNKEAPLNIIHVGSYSDTNYIQQWPEISNPHPTFTQRDSSNGYTYITVTQALPYHVNRLGFDVLSQKFFSENMRIFIAGEKTRSNKSGLTEVGSYTLSLGTIDNAYVPLFKAKQFLLIIYNGDDPPMEINAVHTGQPEREIVAWLDAGKTYKLWLDAADATTPHYSLEKFRDSIPSILPEIALKAVVTAKAGKATEAIFPHQYIWLIMLGMLLLLSLLTWRLTTEMRNKN